MVAPLPEDLRAPFVFRYSSLHHDITIPVALKVGSRLVDALAKIDTGATFCVFERHYAEALGLEVESGEPLWMSTVNGRFQVYGHEVSIEMFEVEHTAVVYFYADHNFGRSVLGRRGWLDRVRMGIVDHDCELYLAPYND